MHSYRDGTTTWRLTAPAEEQLLLVDHRRRSVTWPREDAAALLATLAAIADEPDEVMLRVGVVDVLVNPFSEVELSTRGAARSHHTLIAPIAFVTGWAADVQPYLRLREPPATMAALSAQLFSPRAR